MLKSYLRSAVRSLLSNKASSLINIVGLSIALAAALVVYLFLQVYYTLDTGHVHGDRIAIVEHVATRGGETHTWGTAPTPLGPALAADLPQVEAAVRMEWASGDVRTANASFEERIAFADPDFFRVFTFPLQAGTVDILDTPGEVVVSDEMARKAFGDADPIGQTLTISLADARPQAVTVSAVAAPFPNNAGLRFDVLLPFDARPGAARADDWAALTAATFLLMARPEDLATLPTLLDRYLGRANEAASDTPIERFVIEPLTQPSRDAYTVLQRPVEAPHPVFALLMVSLAALMMVLSCVNFVNIALGSAARRMKEIGVRKVMGGTRAQLVAQFLTENLLMCAISLVVGAGIAHLFLVPLFNGLFVMQIGLSFTANPALWAFLIGLLLFVSLASGMYPALYVASFQPTQIFQGTTERTTRHRLTRGLLFGQFVIACLAVVATAVLVANGRYLVQQDVGYDREGIVAVRLSDAAQFEGMRDAVARLAAVRRVAASPDHVGVTLSRVPVAPDGAAPGDEREVLALDIGPGYAETVGLRLRHGRLFGERLESDAVVVNQRFAREQGWADPVDQTLRMDGKTVTVVGVVADFIYNPVIQAQPLLLRASDAPARFLVARVAPGQEAAVTSALEAAWTRQSPDLPFEAFTQVEVFDEQIATYTHLARGVGILAALALLIACMGVFGMATQHVAQRMKEASIRKVLGATVTQLVFLVNRSFLVLLMLAMLVASGVSLIGLRVLSGFEAANVAPLSPLPFALAYLLVLLAVASSVALQSRSLAQANPADVLRRN